MRTTLTKGRTRPANGNGAYPPGPLPLLDRPPPEPQIETAPPPPPPPTGPGSKRSFYRSRRNPLKLLVKGVVWLVALVLVAAGGLAGGVKLYFDHSVSAINATSPEVRAAVEELAEAGGADKPAVAIVIGYDMRAGDPSAGSRSDTRDIQALTVAGKPASSMPGSVTVTAVRPYSRMPVRATDPPRTWAIAMKP